MPLRATCAALVLATVASAQIPIGKDAAGVDVDTLINCPVAFTSTLDLKGAAVLLEYWATW